MSPNTSYELPLRDLALSAQLGGDSTVGDDGLTDAERLELAARHASRRPSLNGRRIIQQNRNRNSAA